MGWDEARGEMMKRDEMRFFSFLSFFRSLNPQKCFFVSWLASIHFAPFTYGE